MKEMTREIDRLLEENERLEEENELLQDRIDKAIEYIEDRYHIKGTMTYDSPIYHKDLLNILKGNDKK